MPPEAAAAPAAATLHKLRARHLLWCGPMSTDFAFAQVLDLGGDGLRVGVKDSIDIEGFATRMGSACFADAPPARRHAEVVRALLDRGSRIGGKRNRQELVHGAPG